MLYKRSAGLALKYVGHFTIRVTLGLILLHSSFLYISGIFVITWGDTAPTVTFYYKKIGAYHIMPTSEVWIMH